MDLVLRTRAGASCQAGKDFSVMVACSFKASPTICRILQLIRRGLREEKGRLLYQSWNFDVLDCVEWRNMAMAEAAQSDMIVIGLAGCQELSTTVADWLWCSCEMRQGRPGALVAVFDLDMAPEAVSGMVARLKAAAALGRLDFFVSGTTPKPDFGRDVGVGEAARQFVLARKRRTRRMPGEEARPAQCVLGKTRIERMETLRWNE